jgi:hypothetical protein
MPSEVQEKWLDAYVGIPYLGAVYAVIPLVLISSYTTKILRPEAIGKAFLQLTFFVCIAEQDVRQGSWGGLGCLAVGWRLLCGVSYVEVLF